MKARVQCTFDRDMNLTKHLFHTQIKGSNSPLIEAFLIDVMRGPYFGD